MKKIILCGFLALTFSGMSQSLVYDVETQITYSTVVTQTDQGTAFFPGLSEVVSSPEEIIEYQQTGKKPGEGWTLITGPKETILSDGYWGKLCKDQNVWPCAIIKLAKPGY